MELIHHGKVETTVFALELLFHFLLMFVYCDHVNWRSEIWPNWILFANGSRLQISFATNKMILRYNWDIYSKRDALNLCGSISPCKNMGSFLDVTADVWLYPTFMIYDLSLDTPAPNKIKMGPTLVNATRSPFFVRKVSHVFPTTPRFSGSLSCLQDTKYKPMGPHVATQS